MVMFIAAPISGYSQSQASGGAAGGMSVGTAVAIGVVGAALLVALGDSSSSAPAGVTPAQGGADVGGSTEPVTETATATTTTTNAATTTTTN